MIRQALVLAGGMGTRLGAHAGDLPKPLVAVGGRPFLFWLVDELRRHGIERIVLLGGYRGEALVAAFSDADDVEVVLEQSPRGTGGAITLVADRLEERFLLLNGDSLFDVNLVDLAAAMPAHAEAMLAVRRVEDGSRFGALSLDGDRITRFAERPDGPGPALINGGVGVLSRRLVERIVTDRPVSVEREIYPLLAAQGLLAGKVYDGGFIDIGVPEDLARSQALVPALCRRGAVIFDRDGVLNEDTGYPHRPDQIRWIPGAMAAVKAVNDAGLLALVATNQAGIAHGLYGEDDVASLHRWMAGELAMAGAHIDAFAYCPDHPEGKVARYRRVNPWRKPGPGMINHLLDRFAVPAGAAIMIGDKPSDVAAAEAAGIPGIRFTGGDLLAALAPLLPALVQAASSGRNRESSDSATMM